MAHSPPPPKPLPERLESLKEAHARRGVYTWWLRDQNAAGRQTGYRAGYRILRVDPDEVDALFEPIPTVKPKKR